MLVSLLPTAIHTAAVGLTSAVALATLGTATDGSADVSTASAAADTAAAVAGSGWLLPKELWERSPSSWALIVYSSLGPGALATYLQASGQSKVPATQAQVRESIKTC